MGDGDLAAVVNRALDRAEAWFRAAPSFPNRVNLGSVVALRSPAVLSEHDLVLQTARFLNAEGVKWEDIHQEVSSSRWIFDTPHPAAALSKRWRVDLAIVSLEALLAAELPAYARADFAFDALLEFAYGGDWWQQPKVATFGADAPGEFRDKVRKDFAKIEAYLETGAASDGWLVIFEECDHGLDALLTELRKESTRCQVRLVRSYEPGAATLTAS